MTETDWFDATAFDSAYEMQCRIVGTRTEWRHRPSHFEYISEYIGDRPSRYTVRGEGAWRTGLPSDDVVRKRK